MLNRPNGGFLLQLSCVMLKNVKSNCLCNNVVTSIVSLRKYYKLNFNYHAYLQI